MTANVFSIGVAVFSGAVAIVTGNWFAATICCNWLLALLFANRPVGDN